MIAVILVLTGVCLEAAKPESSDLMRKRAQKQLSSGSRGCLVNAEASSAIALEGVTVRSTSSIRLFWRWHQSQRLAILTPTMNSMERRY